jgi:hypothetical protein
VLEIFSALSGALDFPENHNKNNSLKFNCILKSFFVLLYNRIIRGSKENTNKQEELHMPMTPAEYKTFMVESYGEEEINTFIEKHGERNLKFYDELQSAKEKLAKQSSLDDDEVTTVVDEFVDNFDWYSLDSIEDSFNGMHEDLLEFATQLFDDCYASEIPMNLRGYIDYQKFADDLAYDYLITESGAVFCKNF